MRPAFHADRSGVIALWETVFPDDPPHNAPPKVFGARLAVADDMLPVAVEGTTMAGYDGHRGWLHKVAVLPEYRRRDKRPGSRLLRAARLRARKRLSMAGHIG